MIKYSIKRKPEQISWNRSSFAVGKFLKKSGLGFSDLTNESDLDEHESAK